MRKINQAIGFTMTQCKREIVITTQEQYPQNILIEFIQDRTSLLDSFQADDFVKIDINLRGREWTNQQGELKYFNSIQGWRIDLLESNPGVSNEDLPPLDSLSPFEPADDNDDNQELDDLPF